MSGVSISMIVTAKGTTLAAGRGHFRRRRSYVADCRERLERQEGAEQQLFSAMSYVEPLNIELNRR
jgi:hypothetical protein